MTLRTAAYARYSSDAQRDSSIDDQIRNIEEYCRRMGWAQPVIYEDKAISGARSDRPGYQAMLDAAVERRFDVLLVDELSRLSRDHIEGARVGRLLQFHGIRLIGVTDAIDTNMQSFKRKRLPNPSFQ
jgi:DNA invertase Pin-like site-specific DNA recombinase